MLVKGKIMDSFEGSNVSAQVIGPDWQSFCPTYIFLTLSHLILLTLLCDCSHFNKFNSLKSKLNILMDSTYVISRGFDTVERPNPAELPLFSFIRSLQQD